MKATELLAIWFIAAVLLAPFIGSLLHKRRVSREFRSHLDREARIQRQEQLLKLADDYEAASTDKERQRLYRKAEALGFTEGPFMCDENEQPHPPTRAA